MQRIFLAATLCWLSACACNASDQNNLRKLPTGAVNKRLHLSAEDEDQICRLVREAGNLPIISVELRQPQNVVVVTCGKKSPISGGQGIAYQVKKSGEKWLISYSYQWAIIPDQKDRLGGGSTPAPLPQPREKELLEPQAWFKNDTGRPILLWFWTGYGGYEKTWFELSPGDAVPVTLKGPINVATATNKSAKISLKRNLPPPDSSRFYDSQKKSYYYRVLYYRILPDSIEPVLPAETKGWRPVMPHRD